VSAGEIEPHPTNSADAYALAFNIEDGADPQIAGDFVAEMHLPSLSNHQDKIIARPEGFGVLVDGH
jgi:hypothetical protein